MAFTTIDLTDGGSIQIGEAATDGSFVRTEGDNPQISVQFVIWGADNASTAYIALMNYLSTNFSDGNGGIANYDLPLSTVQITTTGSQYSYKGECVFQYPQSSDAGSNSPSATNSNINSSSYSLPEVEDSDFTFETAGGSAHITHALARLGAARYDNGTPVNYGLAINPQEDGSSGGCDIITPTLSFNISLSLPKSWFSLPYRLAIANATGCVNTSDWGGFAAGCLLFKGVNAKATWMKWTAPNGMAMRDWYWRASFSFEAAAAVSVVVGSSTLTARGWDYMSQARTSYADASGNTVSAAEQVDVLQVYPEYDFSLLGIPMKALPD